MGKWNRKSIIYVIGVLVLSVVLGIFSGNNVSAHAEDSETQLQVNLTFRVEGYMDDPYDPYSQDNPNEGAFMPVVGPIDKTDLAGVTTLEFLKKYNSYQASHPELDKEYFAEDKTYIDWLGILFRLANGSLPGDEADTKIKELYQGTPMTQKNLDSWVQAIREIYSQITGDPENNFEIDWERTNGEANKNMKDEVKQIPNGYQLPNFAIYLRPNNYYTHTIKYVVPQGVTAPADHTNTGLIGDEAIEVPSPQIAGYQPSQESVTVNFSKDDAPTTTVYYSKIGTTTPVVVDHSSLTADGTATIMMGQTIDAETFNARATDRDGHTLPVTLDDSRVNYHVLGTYPVVLKAANDKSLTAKLIIKQSAPDTGIVTKGAAVSGLKTLYLYQAPTFNKGQRLAKYPKTIRTKRPMFVVTGYEYAKSGRLRYHVRDVNHHSKTAGKTGYITTKSAYVAPAYYQKVAKRIKVLNPQGINSYQNNDLTKRVKHFKRGRKLTVVGIEHHNLTTRFKLSNGQYVTANKKLVMTLK